MRGEIRRGSSVIRRRKDWHITRSPLRASREASLPSIQTVGPGLVYRRPSRGVLHLVSTVVVITNLGPDKYGTVAVYRACIRRCTLSLAVTLWMLMICRALSRML
jgi:hypothetical protein